MDIPSLRHSSWPAPLPHTLYLCPPSFQECCAEREGVMLTCSSGEKQNSTELKRSKVFLLLSPALSLYLLSPPHPSVPGSFRQQRHISAGLAGRECEKRGWNKKKRKEKEDKNKSHGGAQQHYHFKQLTRFPGEQSAGETATGKRMEHRASATLTNTRECVCMWKDMGSHFWDRT